MSIAPLNIVCFCRGIALINAVSFWAVENGCCFSVNYFPTSINKMFGSVRLTVHSLCDLSICNFSYVQFGF